MSLDNGNTLHLASQRVDNHNLTGIGAFFELHGDVAAALRYRRAYAEGYILHAGNGLLRLRAQFVPDSNGVVVVAEVEVDVVLVAKFVEIDVRVLAGVVALVPGDSPRNGAVVGHNLVAFYSESHSNASLIHGTDVFKLAVVVEERLRVVEIPFGVNVVGIEIKEPDLCR